MTVHKGHNAYELNEMGLPEEPNQCTDEQLAKIWRLMDAPVTIDEDREEILDDDFWIFPKGTSKTFTWHWFDEHFTNGLAKALGWKDTKD